MSAIPLADALGRIADQVGDPDVLVRAVFSGRQRGRTPRWRRAELRWVDLKSGPHLQITGYDATQAHTSNHPAGGPAREAVVELLAEPFGNWHVDTLAESVQVRATKKLAAMVHTTRRESAEPGAGDDRRAHDRDKPRVFAEDDPVLVALGISDAAGRVKPTRRAKYRQVEEFVRLLDAAVTDAIDGGHLRRPSEGEPLRVADLGCGNAYLTFAAHRFLNGHRGLPVAFTGVDVKEQSREHNAALAHRLGIDAAFVVGSIGEVSLDPAPEVVLALHACDTATDDALARAVAWEAPLILAAPCCHHDIAAQLRTSVAGTSYALLTRHGILRERLADTLTDGARAALLRLAGYRVDVVEFVGSEHTPRNTLLRAVRTGDARADGPLRAEYDDLVRSFGITPKLARLLR